MKEDIETQMKSAVAKAVAQEQGKLLAKVQRGADRIARRAVNDAWRQSVGREALRAVEEILNKAGMREHVISLVASKLSAAVIAEVADGVLREFASDDTRHKFWLHRDVIETLSEAIAERRVLSASEAA